MTKVLNIRPHHLICLPGYKGVNYSQKSKTSWDVISNNLKENPDTMIKIVEGPDSLCKNCPKKGANCTESFSKTLDQAVEKLLELKTGAIYAYKELAEKLKNILNPQKHEKICGDCFWRTQGFCGDTFKK